MIRYLKRYIAQDGSTYDEYVEISCLSTDTKPTDRIVNGSICNEVDTGKVFFFDEESAVWIEQFSFKNGGGGGTVEKFTITFTPTGQDMSGTMDKTSNEIKAAIEAGNLIEAYLDASSTLGVTVTMPATAYMGTMSGNYAVEFIGIIPDTPSTQILFLTDAGNESTSYFAHSYTLTDAS